MKNNEHIDAKKTSLVHGWTDPVGRGSPMSLRSVQAIDRVGTDQVKKKEIKTKDKKRNE